MHVRFILIFYYFIRSYNNVLRALPWILDVVSHKGGIRVRVRE